MEDTTRGLSGSIKSVLLLMALLSVGIGSGVQATTPPTGAAPSLQTATTHPMKYYISLPKGWSADLRKTYESTNRPNPEHIADLMKRVEVDWKADPKVLAETPEPPGDQPPFRVIRLRNGSRVHGSGAEPNRLVWYHLHERRGEQAQTQSTTSPASVGGIK